jgi:hypothetical protein
MDTIIHSVADRLAQSYSCVKTPLLSRGFFIAPYYQSAA